MDSTLTIGSSLSHLKSPSTPSLAKPRELSLPRSLPFPFLKPPKLQQGSNSRVRASSNFIPKPNGRSLKNPIIQKLKTVATAIVLAAVASSMIGKFHQLPVRAESLPPWTEKCIGDEVENQPEKAKESSPSVVSVDALRLLLIGKLKMGEDEEALKILKELVLAQPEEIEWRFLMVKLLNEMGKLQEARNVFEDILKSLDKNKEAREQFPE